MKTRDTAYKESTRNQIKNPDGSYRPMTDTEYLIKLNAAVHINELAQISKKWKKPNVTDTKKHRFAKDGFSYRTAYFKDFDGKYYRVTISVGENGGISTVYNVAQIKKDTLPNGKIKTILSGSKANNVSNSIILENSKKINPSSEKSSEKSFETVDTAKRSSLKEKNQVHLKSDTEFDIIDSKVKKKGNASREPGQYSQEDYSNYGWVRENNVISAGHWKTFTTNFADAVAREYYFNKTPDGEFMIEAYNYYDPLSEADVIVFAKGTIESPDITKIIKVDTTQNIDLDTKRSIVYEAERRGIPPTAGDVFGFYYKTDYTGKFKHSRNGEEGNRNNNELGVKRGRSAVSANPVVKSEVNEDEGTVTITYKNGDVVTKPWGKDKTDPKHKDLGRRSSLKLRHNVTYDEVMSMLGKLEGNEPDRQGIKPQKVNYTFPWGRNLVLKAVEKPFGVSKTMWKVFL